MLIFNRGSGDEPLHNVDVPTIVTDFTEYWYADGKLSKTDGPAVRYLKPCSFRETELTHRWLFLGEEYTFETWCRVLNKSHEEITFLRLNYGLG